MYKLKQIPEDFIVEEMPDRQFSAERNEKMKYSVYLLKKTSYNTEDAVQEICRRLNIQRKNVAYAGTKDRNAVTSQYLSILGKAAEMNVKDISLSFMGYSDSPLSLGSLKGNKFTIAVRNIDSKEEKTINANKKMNEFINYFDEQRFSSNNAAIGKLIIGRKYKDACELICTENSRMSDELKKYLSEKPNAHLNALKLVPRKTLMIYVHAYQSLLWNMAVWELQSAGKRIDFVPLLGFGTEFEEDTDRIYAKIMLDENISLRDFILRDFPEISLEGHTRNVMAKIHDFHAQNFEDDDLNSGMRKVTVSFWLEKGAYATLAIKNLLGEGFSKINLR